MSSAIEPWRRHVTALTASARLPPLVAGAAVAVLASAPAGGSPPAPVIVVAADGSGDYRTVQEAIDAVADNSSIQVTILIRPGTHRGVINIPAARTNIRLTEAGHSPASVVVVENRSNGTLKPDGTTYGTSGSATATINGRAFTATNLAIASHIHTLPRGGSVTAAGTPAERAYGLLFKRCRFTGTAQAASSTLGRPWRPNGAVVIRESELGSHINTAQPWTDMSGNPWTGARFFEYHNKGPGSGNNGNRPQLTGSQAAIHTAKHYLAGTDGWNPTGKP